MNLALFDAGNQKVSGRSPWPAAGGRLYVTDGKLAPVSPAPVRRTETDQRLRPPSIP